MKKRNVVLLRAFTLLYIISLIYTVGMLIGSIYNYNHIPKSEDTLEINKIIYKSIAINHFEESHIFELKIKLGSELLLLLILIIFWIENMKIKIPIKLNNSIERENDTM